MQRTIFVIRLLTFGVSPSYHTSPSSSGCCILLLNHTNHLRVLPSQERERVKKKLVPLHFKFLSHSPSLPPLSHFWPWHNCGSLTPVPHFCPSFLPSPSSYLQHLSPIPSAPIALSPIILVTPLLTPSSHTHASFCPLPTRILLSLCYMPSSVPFPHAFFCTLTIDFLPHSWGLNPTSSGPTFRTRKVKIQHISFPCTKLPLIMAWVFLRTNGRHDGFIAQIPYMPIFPWDEPGILTARVVRVIDHWRRSQRWSRLEWTSVMLRFSDSVHDPTYHW